MTAYQFDPLERQLPLLDHAETFLPDVQLDNTLVVAIQHLLPTTYPLFHAFFRRGLSPDNLFVLGKCYSTNPSVAAALSAEGVHISEESAAFDSHLSYDEMFDKSVCRFFSEVCEKKELASFERVLFLDDGGHLLQMVHDKKIDHPGCVGIEQTSSGYNRTAHLDLSFPIINLARCWAKLTYETPIVIESINSEIVPLLESTISKESNVLLLGRGFLGDHFRQGVKKGCQIKCYDLDPAKSDFSIEELPDVLEESHVVIGCTGQTSLSSEMHAHLHPSAVLISLSSSDREFDAVHLRRKIPRYTDCHAHVDIDGVTLFNTGFPANFHDDYNTVDHERFQFTRALILASVLQAQAMPCTSMGYCDLDRAMQEEICDLFLATV